jgi:hypothetical protein
MKHFVIYNNTGEILRSGTCQDQDFELQVLTSDELIIEASADPAKDIINIQTGEVVGGGKPPPLVYIDYRTARRQAYPAISDQLDMLWHAMDNNTLTRVEPFYSRIKAVKEAYPKDNSVVPGSASI